MRSVAPHHSARVERIAADHEANLFRPLSVFRLFVVPASLSALVLAVLSGCMQMSAGRPDGPWHTAYRPVEDPASEAFVAEALAYAVELFGDPVIPVNQVMIRRSRKTREARRCRIEEDFSLTECVDPTNGIFVIYLAVDPGHRNYFALLGHECAHLLNPDIFDWYMEGFASVFSEQVCAKTGHEWGDWKHYFERTRREPYGLSYRMMLELQDAFPHEYPSILRYTAENGGGKGRLHLDIDAWLATLPPDGRRTAVAIIEGYSDALMRRTSAEYYFSPPLKTGR